MNLQPLDDGQADKTIRDYVCSTCWGDLVKWPAPERKWLVLCRSCQGETQGYVTRSFAEQRRAESRLEKVQVNKLLIDLGILPKPPKRTEEEQLRDMGF